MTTNWLAILGEYADKHSADFTLKYFPTQNQWRVRMDGDKMHSGEAMSASIQEAGEKLCNTLKLKPKEPA